MKRRLSVKTHVVAVTLTFFLLCHVAFAQFGQVTDSDAAMRNIRKHLTSPSEQTYNEPLLFVGVTDSLGPVCSMCVCKGALSQKVDFRIETVLWGKFKGHDLQVQTGYINCTGQSLPAPPFTLQGRVIVYCKQVPYLGCIAPVVFSHQRLAMVQKWLAGLNSKPAKNGVQQ
jgi:hypothetical protein